MTCVPQRLKKTSYFIMKSYFYKSLMAEGFKTSYFQPFDIMDAVRFYDSKNRHFEFLEPRPKVLISSLIQIHTPHQIQSCF